MRIVARESGASNPLLGTFELRRIPCRRSSQNAPSRQFSRQPRSYTGYLGLLLAGYPAGALAPPAADGLDNLLAIVIYGAEEHPSLQAVEAAPSLLVPLVGGGVLGALR